MCVLLITRLLRGVGRWARKPVNHTSWVAVVTPTDRPKSVRNCCLMELFVALFVLLFCPFYISVGIGAFVIGLGQISSFLSFYDVQAERKRKRKRSDSVLWHKRLHQQKYQKGKVTSQTTTQKSSIRQRLRTDSGRSVGVTTAILAEPSNFPQQPSNQKGTHLKICKKKKLPYIDNKPTATPSGEVIKIDTRTA